MLPKKAVAILQSNYIPWKGYFDLIRCVDEFILFDDVQYTRRDWRNRNRIKTPEGAIWLTIPVDTKGKYLQKIRDTEVSDSRWAEDHWRTVQTFLARARFFGDYRNRLEQVYEKCAGLRRLSEINHEFLRFGCEALGIGTRLSWSMDHEIVDGKNERLISLSKQVGATEYVSGPAAKTYIEPAAFEAEGIRVRFVDYSGYPEYGQLYPPFIHEVSVLDLILNEGPEAGRYMKRL